MSAISANGATNDTNDSSEDVWVRCVMDLGANMDSDKIAIAFSNRCKSDESSLGLRVDATAMGAISASNAINELSAIGATINIIHICEM